MFSTPHMLLQWSGPFVDGVSADSPVYEGLVGGLRFSGPGIEDVNNQATANALGEVLRAYWASPAAAIPVSARITTIKWNLIGRDGKYVSTGDTQIADYRSTPGAELVRYPTQIAWCTTWTTSRTRGRASKGRTYWPTAQPVENPSSLVNAAATQAKARADWKLIQDLNNAMPSSATQGVSACVMSNIGEGTTSVIAGARVGSRLDIQRRRGAQMEEKYQKAP